MSVAIATMGMFIPSVGFGPSVGGTGGVVMKEDPKPQMKVLRIEEIKVDELNNERIIVKMVS